jgi:hypothetical protein
MRLSLLLLALSACSDPSPAPADMSAPCNPVTPSCTKCAVTAYDQNGAVTACLTAGTKPEGELCTRAPAAPGAPRDTLGPDDCAAGLHCSALGGLGTTEATHISRCWAYCATDAMCGAGKKCISINESPVIGLCVPTCTPFAACANGFNCSFILPATDGSSAYLGCREPGNRPAAAFCDDGTQCAADSVCNPIATPRVCAPLCDATHPCAAGSCLAIPGNSGSICLF